MLLALPQHFILLLFTGNTLPLLKINRSRITSRIISRPPLSHLKWYGVDVSYSIYLFDSFLSCSWIDISVKSLMWYQLGHFTRNMYASLQSMIPSPNSIVNHWISGPILVVQLGLWMGHIEVAARFQKMQGGPHGCSGRWRVVLMVIKVANSLWELVDYRDLLYFDMWE